MVITSLSQWQDTLKVILTLSKKLKEVLPPYQKQRNAVLGLRRTIRELRWSLCVGMQISTKK